MSGAKISEMSGIYLPVLFQPIFVDFPVSMGQHIITMNAS